MNRRTIVKGAAAALTCFPGVALGVEAPPWRMALIGGGFTDGSWLAGVRIDLEEGWDTYWRMPGDAGIPPSFDWKNSEGVAAVEVLYPVPQRLETAAGETVGYQSQVIFPVRVKPATKSANAKLSLDLFFAVCKDICIPAKAKSSLSLVASSGTSGDEEVTSWLKRVPTAGTPVASVTAEATGGQTMLVVKLAGAAIDIFVESESAYYFRKPAFSADGLEAKIAVEGPEDPQRLHGLPLKLTVVAKEAALEQQVTVA
jgi:DsbC/DsbD-like thiol-disulfide interchange protein